ncbi:MAG: alanine dehydrogenase, partial [Candidatus Latescibacteria bacterium]|nr:alanine dehydrogenase [Candidatus Latescibacterota bacterium]
MIIGIPKEIKAQESRVAAVPAGVYELVRDGHKVMIQEGAGLGSGFTDEEYEAVGALIAGTSGELFAEADMIMKVKEPLAPEYSLIRPGQIIFTYFHFAASEELTRAMQATGALCVAYETLEAPDGSLP